MRKMWFINTMGFYSSFRENEIMTFARQGMELEIIVLHEVSQVQRVWWEEYGTRMDVIGREPLRGGTRGMGTDIPERNERSNCE